MAPFVLTESDSAATVLVADLNFIFYLGAAYRDYRSRDRKIDPPLLRHSDET